MSGERLKLADIARKLRARIADPSVGEGERDACESALARLRDKHGELPRPEQEYELRYKHEWEQRLQTQIALYLNLEPFSKRTVVKGKAGRWRQVTHVIAEPNVGELWQALYANHRDRMEEAVTGMVTGYLWGSFPFEVKGNPKKSEHLKKRPSSRNEQEAEKFGHVLGEINRAEQQVAIDQE